MTSSIADVQKYRLLVVLFLGMLAWNGTAWAQSQTVIDVTKAAVSDQNDPAAVDRGKMRLQLLISLVENELRAAIESKARLTTERSSLERERNHLKGLSTPLRSGDKERLERIEQRLLSLNDALAAADALLPEVTKELDDLQHRLDAANGIVRPVVPAAAANDAAKLDPAPSRWSDRDRQVQEALAYLGGYNALIDGDMGPRTRQAVKVYQELNAFEPTGVLTEGQEKALLQEAKDLRTFYGVRPFGDGKTGYRLSYPSSLLSEVTRAAPGVWQMTTSDRKGELLITVSDGSSDLAPLYSDAINAYEVQYRRKRNSWFVVAGRLDPERIIYDTAHQTEGGLIRARLTYPLGWRNLWSRFAVIMFNTFEPVPRGES